jgi:hypothetical protein
VAVRTAQDIALDTGLQTPESQAVRAARTVGEAVSELEKFKLSFEHHESYPAIRKALKQRTIKILKRRKADGQNKRKAN